MAQKVLIMGESGTGKSTSLRNCDPATTAVINPVGKPLPFKNHFEMLNNETDARKIVKYMKEQCTAGKKLLVVDDFQYILAVPYMNRIKETGWDKYNDFGANYFEIIDCCKDLPDDVVVVYMTHLETLDNGLTTVKLIGKLLREKITIEGLFTVVLRTGVNEAKYYFYTQNSGKDTVKSPLGMFTAYAIDNDLNYVVDKIRNYYELGDYKSDDEMNAADQAVASDLENLTAKAEEQEVKKLNLQHQQMHRKKRLEEHVRVGQKFRQTMNRRLLIIWMKLTRLLIRLFRDRKKYHLMKQWMLPIKYRNRIYRNHQEEHVRKEMLKSLKLFRTVQQTLILNLSHWKQMHISMTSKITTM